MKTIETINTICKTDASLYRAKRDYLLSNIKTLDSIVRDAIDNGGKVRDAVKEFVKQVGSDAAVQTVASLVNRSAWDGRISSANANWAKDVEESWDEDAMVRMGAYCKMHMAHLDQTADYIRRSLDELAAEIEAEREESKQTDATIHESELDEAVCEEVQKELDAERDGFTITKNEQFGSVEVSFNEKPSAEIRDALKLLRFRWHGQRGIWYGYRDEETVRAAIMSANPDLKKGEAKQTKTAKAKKPEKVNKFGVKVGDFFSASWGYEQTNADFFQVVALVGESSVRVREVNPPIIEDKATGPMACYRVYDIRNTGELLPPSPSSVFIKDQERGDLKRLKSYNEDNSFPQFFLDSFANAHYCGGDTKKMYESWYY